MNPKSSSKRTVKRHKGELSGELEISENVRRSQDKRRKRSQSSLEMSRAEDVSGDLVKAVPKCIMDFYKHAQNLCPSDPCAAFTKLVSARLVGVFDLLCGGFSQSEEQRLLYCRHATDLPEMQTVLLCQIGRYCLWRDVPNGKECFILYVPNSTRFPNIELVGNNMEHALLHLGEKVNMSVEKFLSTPVNCLRKQMQTVCAERIKKKLGKAPNGVGLWVESINDIGYRPISESPVKIRKMLELICDTDDDSKRQSVLKWLMEIARYVQMADDEGDFGMGLEFGYWLFLANHESLDKIAHKILSKAYTLLHREEYKKILDLQMSPGVRRKEVVARK